MKSCGVELPVFILFPNVYGFMEWFMLNYYLFYFVNLACDVDLKFLTM